MRDDITRRCNSQDILDYAAVTTSNCEGLQPATVCFLLVLCVLWGQTAASVPCHHIIFILGPSLAEQLPFGMLLVPWKRERRALDGSSHLWFLGHNQLYGLHNLGGRSENRAWDIQCNSTIVPKRGRTRMLVESSKGIRMRKRQEPTAFRKGAV